MSKSNLQAKEDARSHIVNALKLVHFMDNVKYGDWPEQQEKYEKEITKAKRELRQVYSPDNVIFSELDLDTNIGLMASLGSLGLGDEPFIDMKHHQSEDFGAETFESEMKNLLLEYVETIHPDNEQQQNQLMDLILSGDYEVPLDEMQTVVEKPSLARPHMREMALASESFSPTISNKHNPLARSQNHMGAESYGKHQNPHNWEVRFVDADGEAIRLRCRDCGHEDYSSCKITDMYGNRLFNKNRCYPDEDDDERMVRWHDWVATEIPSLRDDVMAGVRVRCRRCNMNDTLQTYAPYGCEGIQGACQCDSCDFDREQKIREIDYAVL